MASLPLSLASLRAVGGLYVRGPTASCRWPVWRLRTCAVAALPLLQA